MSSPFPGMDPYLEGHLWPDVHNALASKIRQLLVPQLKPRYTARLEIYLVEDNSPEQEVGILYPDVEILQPKQSTAAPLQKTDVATTAATLQLPVIQPIQVRVPTIEIRDVQGNLLVTCIEILSPANKRDQGLVGYRAKRQRLYRSGVHLLEIDLLRRGKRPYEHPRLPNTPYLISLVRAGETMLDLWPLKLDDVLPVLPVPLRTPDLDVVLDLGNALSQVYDEAAYELSIDYSQDPPPPALSAEEQDWIQQLLQ